VTVFIEEYFSFLFVEPQLHLIGSVEAAAFDSPQFPIQRR
jgi:hypothetical protein